MADPVRTVVIPPPLPRTLRRGDHGDDVRLVQTILQAEGYFKGTPLGNFGPVTETAVRHFQGTHIGVDGKFLEADGQVGPKTWWALFNPHGDAQRSYIPTPAPPSTLTQTPNTWPCSWLSGGPTAIRTVTATPTT